MSQLVHQIFKNFAHVIVVGSLFEFKIPTILQKDTKFFREASSKRFYSSLYLFVFNSIKFVIFVFSSCKTLPWQTALQKVDKDEAYWLEVISPTLFDSKVCVYTCITSSSSQWFIVFVRNVLTCFWISVPLCEAEIDQVNYVLLLTMANKVVIRFTVSMDEMVIVQEFKSWYHLVRDH